MIEKRADLLFEISWEICNKVGGIYTVIKSKVARMIEIYNRENYILIGPYFLQKVRDEFIEKTPPEDLVSIFDKLKNEGIICHYGNWFIYDKPQVVLIDYNNYMIKRDEIKTLLWEKFKIDSLESNYFYFDEPVVWGWCVGKVLEEINNKFKDKKIVAHFHEYITGSGILYIKYKGIKIATVFTTHATVLGRHLSMNNINIYNNITSIDVKKEIYKYKIHAQHLLELNSAKESDVFTTVSKITELETKTFLDRNADLLLPNGLDISGYPTFEEVILNHKLYKEKIRKFLIFYFFPYYTFDVEDSLIFFISGRHELHNKGADLFIEALSKLNKRLIEEKSNKTIIVFIWIPGDVYRIKPEIVENRIYFEDILEYFEEILPEVRNRLLRSIISKKEGGIKELLGKLSLFEIEKRVNKFLKNGNPPIVTHDLKNYDSDDIIKTLNAAGLNNDIKDKVKVIYYPIYLTGADFLIDLSYNEAVMGTHLGVFPSYYEPWGYTPLETGVMGVVSVTTDLGGFGNYIKDQIIGNNPGMFVSKRMNQTPEKEVENLFHILYYFSKLSRDDRVKNKQEARRLASLADWKYLIDNYIQAHNLAIKRCYT